jgi:hypothetical protein
VPGAFGRKRARLREKARGVTRLHRRDAEAIQAEAALHSATDPADADAIGPPGVIDG